MDFYLNRQHPSLTRRVFYYTPHTSYIELFYFSYPYPKVILFVHPHIVVPYYKKILVLWWILFCYQNVTYTESGTSTYHISLGAEPQFYGTPGGKVLKIIFVA